jgi:hypothetical protein
MKSGTIQKIHSRTYRVKAAHDKKIRRNLLHDNEAGGFGFRRAAAELPRRLLPPSLPMTDYVNRLIFHGKKGGLRTRGNSPLTPYLKYWSCLSDRLIKRSSYKNALHSFESMGAFLPAIVGRLVSRNYI